MIEYGLVASAIFVVTLGSIEVLKDKITEMFFSSVSTLSTTDAQGTAINPEQITQPTLSPDAVLTPTPLKNGDAERGHSGWDLSKGLKIERDADGNHFFFGGKNNGDAEMSQMLSAPDKAAAQTMVHLEWQQSSKAAEDAVCATLVFADQQKREISRTKTPRSATQGGVWTTRSLDVEIPDQAAFVTAIFNFTRIAGKDNDAAVDNITLAWAK